METGPKILNIKRSDQYKTIGDLFDRSHPDSVYFTFLILSSIVIVAGILFESIAVLIGGMLITPVLTPILLIALGISVGEPKTIKSSLLLVLKSIAFVILISLVLGIVFGAPNSYLILEDSIRTAMLYFVVALAGGMTATFAWVRREVDETIPGAAIAVSLMPPLAILGVSLSSFNVPLARLALTSFTLNIFGVLVGSLIVFSMLKFHKTEKVVQKEAKAQEKEQLDIKKAKEKEADKVVNEITK
jgi:uncharacterized hydrophobic protein (TIGR00271 family)